MPRADNCVVTARSPAMPLADEDWKTKKPANGVAGPRGWRSPATPLAGMKMGIAKEPANGVAGPRGEEYWMGTHLGLTR